MISMTHPSLSMTILFVYVQAEVQFAAKRPAYLSPISGHGPQHTALTHQSPIDAN